LAHTPLSELPPMKLTLLDRVWLIVLRLYLALAAGMLEHRLVQLAVSGSAAA
jgi:hypothetical protein